MSPLTPTKRASICAWATSVSSTSPHHVNIADDRGLEPVCARDAEGNLVPEVPQPPITSITYGPDGRVFDWTDFSPYVSLPARPAHAEYVEVEREEGYFTDMSGLTITSSSNSSSSSAATTTAASASSSAAKSVDLTPIKPRLEENPGWGKLVKGKEGKTVRIGVGESLPGWARGRWKVVVVDEEGRGWRW